MVIKAYHDLPSVKTVLDKGRENTPAHLMPVSLFKAAAAELDKLIRARSELKKRSLFSIHSPRSGENGSPASPRSGV
jgi:hypothetical protein